jgi:fructoselysine-6-phosphate deglycase
MQPEALLLTRKSTFPVFMDVSAELILAGDPHLGPHSIVVIPSLSGTTRESVAVMDYCKERGATIISLIGHADTPMVAADHVLVNLAEDDTSSESFYLQSLLIALSVMRHRGACPDYARVVAELRGLPTLLVDIKRACE